MARITVEDCLENESNRFALVRLAARRAKQLLSGGAAVTDTKGNREIVSALREIADGKVSFSIPPQEEGADEAPNDNEAAAGEEETAEEAAVPSPSISASSEIEASP